MWLPNVIKWRDECSNADVVYSINKCEINVKVFGDFKQFQKYQYINTFSVNDVITTIIQSYKKRNELLLLQIISININRFRNTFI